ncbi:hypothetical protein [Ottowia sp.]|uniref:hypothetical protein n=1 Tax=Ottowia sp. TaxID=1898956 RepID=UPI0025DFEFF1|nr:hypothetical protein [Ottowia sp.]MBK6616320.1 hypothetical protein [Ottowia sp.]
MYGKRDYNIMAGKRVAAFVAIARKLGKEHPITKMMGARAWGRHGFEQGPTSTLRTAIREVAALDGAFDVINQWACDNDAAAQRVLRELYPRSMESAPEGSAS